MYQVLYRPLETFNGAIGPQAFTVSDNSGVLTNLEEFVSYNISIRAYTRIGVGPFSPDITIVTPEDGEWYQGTTLPMYMLCFFFK